MTIPQFWADIVQNPINCRTIVKESNDCVQLIVLRMVVEENYFYDDIQFRQILPQNNLRKF